jgi:hypothetical protein
MSSNTSVRDASYLTRRRKIEALQVAEIARGRPALAGQFDPQTSAEVMYSYIPPGPPAAFLQAVAASELPPRPADFNYTEEILFTFLETTVAAKRNSPTFMSVFAYIYFLFLHNVCTLFYASRFPFTDDITIDTPAWYAAAKTTILGMTGEARESYKNNILCFSARIMLGILYPTVTLPALPFSDNRFNTIAPNLAQLTVWAQSHYNSRVAMLSKAGMTPNADLGLPTMPVDIQGFTQDLTEFFGSEAAKNEKIDKWLPIRIPNGKYTVTVEGRQIPAINFADLAGTSSIQGYLGREWGNVKGFCVDPTVTLPEYAVSTTWAGGLKRETDEVIEVFAGLNDRQKAIAEFFAGTSPSAVPPPGFWYMIAYMMAQKYNQTIAQNLELFFCIGANLFDASIAAWRVKRQYEQGRPATLIRAHYKDNDIVSWWPYVTGPRTIKGREWMPYQPFTFVTPPFPDVMSGHSTFSASCSEILQWWFKTNQLYSPGVNVTLKNPKIFSPLLNKTSYVLGRFVVPAGSSEVEPGFAPAEPVVLQYDTISALAADAGVSRVYGGIHTNETNRFSLELGAWVGKRVVEKLQNSVGIYSPY